MASSSLSHRRNEEHDAFSGIEPQNTRRKVEESSRLFDVFINHRGPDVKQTVALQLYNSLRELGIHAFLDSEEKELGDSFLSTIEKAIHSSSAHVAIFSKGYAESPWCLAELVLMLQSKAKIIPLFYEMEPSALRYIEKGKYAKAFTKYEEKGRYMEKLKEWKEALQSVSFITGYEISSNFNIRDCQTIVSAVQKEVQRKKSLHVAKYPVGLHRLVKEFERVCLHQLVEDFETHCWTNEGGKEKAQIVGIFGMGGVGKTTLVKELFNRKHSQYGRACFLFDVREAYANNSFPSLQMKLVKDLFQEDRFSFQSREEGQTHITDCIERSNQLSFLIVVDDIDHVQQLDALLIMEMLKKSVDSLVIVTTRDVGVLINTGITVAYNLKGMERDDARELFCWHAFDQPHPANDYENLVNSFLNVCGGLPLSLQVLGSHVHGRDQNYWNLELNKVSKTLPQDIHQSLRISFDALDYDEQQIFMDIACFFVDKSKSIAMDVWKASGWSAEHALQTLKNKCLVQEIEERSKLRMHDHLRDLGREMANGQSHPCRLWRPQDLKNLESKGFRNILTQVKGRCFHSVFDNSLYCRIRYFLGESDVSADTSTFLLWLELQHRGLPDQRQPCIPSWIPLQNLRFLIISNLRLKTLWRGHVKTNILQNLRIRKSLKTLRQSNVQVPTQLKELKIYNTSLKKNSDLSGLSNSLEKIIIDNCSSLKTMSGLSDLKKLIDLNISNCLDLQKLSVVNLNCVEKIVIQNCCSLKTVSGISDLRMLVELDISGCPVFEQLCLVGLENLKRITVDDSFKPEFFELGDCRYLKTISGNLNVEKLVSINIRECPKLELLPSFEGPGMLETLTIDGCMKLNSLHLSRCQNLKRVTGKFDLTKLFIRDCPAIEALSFLQDVTCLEIIAVDGCGKPNSLQLKKCQNLKQLCISNCLELEELTCCPPEACIEKISIVKCGKIKNITLPTELVELVIKGCREVKTVATICNHVSQCPELSSVSQLSCLKSIASETCDKLQTIQGIERCGKLIIDECGKLTIDGYGKLTSFQLFRSQSLREVRISNCPELQELLSVARPSYLKRITIETCNKLQTLQGIGELHALESLGLYDCAELVELLFSTLQSGLENIKIVRCGKMQKVTIPRNLVQLIIEGCSELKTVAVVCDHSKSLELQEQIIIQTWDKLQSVQDIDELRAVGSLQLFNCEELAELSCFALETCLDKISIVRCGKLQSLTLPTKLEELKIEECRELKTVRVICDHSECLQIEELSYVARLRCLKRITIHSCDKLQIIQGIEELHALESLDLFNCPELEELPFFALQTCFEKISIVSCEKMQNITLSTKLVELRIKDCRELKTMALICDHSEFLGLHELSSVVKINCLKRITIQTCDKLQTIQGIDKLHALESFQLFNCGELEELPCFALKTCLEKISIVRCGKLQNITLPINLVELEIVECRDLKTMAVICDQIESPEESKEFQSIARLNCLKRIRIQNSHKLHTIKGINTLHALEKMQLLHCSDAIIRNCISMLESVPEELLVVVGKAVDGALSILIPDLFSGIDAIVSEISTARSDNRQKILWDSTVIYCAVIMDNTSTAQQREWIVTGVTTDWYYGTTYYNFLRHLDDVEWHGIMKKGYKLAIKKGEDWKFQHVLHTILNRLYK